MDFDGFSAQRDRKKATISRLFSEQKQLPYNLGETLPPLNYFSALLRRELLDELLKRIAFSRPSR